MPASTWHEWRKPARELDSLVPWIGPASREQGVACPRGRSSRNLYLNETDKAMAAAKLPLVRFADDLLIVTPTREAALAAMEFVAKTLEKCGLCLHPRKTRITHAGPHVVFLGEKGNAPPRPPPNRSA